ncbi:uncharacterized protein LOC116424478 [Nomia melanderi]|uniref:uncharacterized protein LOC116424478 n=1 Tax=Nomia melanderi TaxID=2448451 RepID=UPI001304006F|nr:uncharacterized protein LOC116424478 [Nomia melanderi]
MFKIIVVVLALTAGTVVSGNASDELDLINVNVNVLGDQSDDGSSAGEKHFCLNLPLLGNLLCITLNLPRNATHPGSNNATKSDGAKGGLEGLVDDLGGVLDDLGGTLDNVVKNLLPGGNKGNSSRLLGSGSVLSINLNILGNQTKTKASDSLITLTLNVLGDESHPKLNQSDPSSDWNKNNNGDEQGSSKSSENSGEVDKLRIHIGKFPFIHQ